MAEVINQTVDKQMIRMTQGHPNAYEGYFGIDITLLEGPILDVGTGTSAISHRLDVHRTTKHYFYLNNEARESVDNHNLVTADAMHLPYASSSFQNVLALYSVPMYFMEKRGDEKEYDHEKTVRFLEEVYRVLKAGGSAYLYPIHLNYLMDTLRPFADRFKFQRYDADTGTGDDFDPNLTALVLTKI